MCRVCLVNFKWIRISTDRPTAPSPKIATVDPSSTSATFHAAPSPAVHMALGPISINQNKFKFSLFLRWSSKRGNLSSSFFPNRKQKTSDLRSKIKLSYNIQSWGHSRHRQSTLRAGDPNDMIILSHN